MNTMITMDQIRKNREIMKANYKPELVTPFLIIKSWWEQMPDVQREPYYIMRWLVDTLGFSPGVIGVALAQIGFTRGRSFQKNKPFYRTWVPPTQK